MRRFLGALILGGSLLVACSSGVDAIAVVANAPGSVGLGQQRVLVALIDEATGQYLASPDLDVVATLRDRIGSPLGDYEAEFVWVVPEARGLYSFHMDIPGAGTFQLTFDAGDLGRLGPVGLVTIDDPAMVEPGEAAPLSETRTLSTDDLANLTSDPNPDPAFYEMSVAEAVAAGPSVIVFGTPAWCTSQACGPLLDQVKALSVDFPDLNYVHVEVYENIHVSSREDLILVPSVLEWGLPSEPWVFVTDSAGKVSASFEGAASDRELADAFAAVSG